MSYLYTVFFHDFSFSVSFHHFFIQYVAIYFTPPYDSCFTETYRKHSRLCEPLTTSQGDVPDDGIVGELYLDSTDVFFFGRKFSVRFYARFDIIWCVFVEISKYLNFAYLISCTSICFTFYSICIGSI